MQLPIFALLQYIQANTVTPTDMSACTAAIAALQASALTDESDITTLASNLSGLTSTVSNIAGQYVSTTALATSLAGYATTAALTAGLAGKANTVHTHAISDVTGLQTALDLKPQVYNASGATTGTPLVKPVIFTGLVTLATAGTATMNLTTDGTATGTALFTNPNNVQVTVNEATTVWPCSFTVSANKKVLTLTVNKAATPLLSLLGLNILAAPTAAPIGTVVQVLATGN